MKQSHLYLSRILWHYFISTSLEINIKTACNGITVSRFPNQHVAVKASEVPSEKLVLY